MPIWLNFVGYQAAWLIAVAAAGRGMWWPGVLACAGFVLIAAWRSSDYRADLKLALAALVCGLLVDGTLAGSGALHYAAAEPGLPAPIWILAMWAAFAMTLRHSLRWLLPRAWLAALFGAIGGPLAYWGAARGFAAVEFVMPQAATAFLMVGWALALLLLVRLARGRASDLLAHSEASI